MKKLQHENSNQKRNKVDILISDKIVLKTKTITGNQEK